MSSQIALDGPLTEQADSIQAKIEGQLRRQGETTSEAERARTEALIARMLLQGADTASMVAATNLHRTTIGYYVKKLSNDWKLEAQKSLTELKARELAKLDNLESEAWDAWNRSQQPIKKSQFVAEMGGTEKEPVRTPKSAKTMSEDRIGDPKYLDIVFKCITARMKLLGLGDIDMNGGKRNDTNKLSERTIRYREILAREVVQITGGTAGPDDSGERVDPERSPRTPGGVPDIIDV